MGVERERKREVYLKLTPRTRRAPWRRKRETQPGCVDCQIQITEGGGKALENVESGKVAPETVSVATSSSVGYIAGTSVREHLSAVESDARETERTGGRLGGSELGKLGGWDTKGGDTGLRAP